MGIVGTVGIAMVGTENVGIVGMTKVGCVAIVGCDVEVGDGVGSLDGDKLGFEVAKEVGVSAFP